MSVYGYTRVSTDRQADEGESLGAQQRVIEGYAMMLGLTLDEIFVERGVSGSPPPRDRPEGSRVSIIPGSLSSRTVREHNWASADRSRPICNGIGGSRNCRVLGGFKRWSQHGRFLGIEATDQVSLPAFSNRASFGVGS